ncbi:cytochrome b [Acidihalobacter ferrooxydans]|uniref:Cytochrome b n=1 Tax=Acidihalobacter ferrooxydans TaxID=1765967 RepID=A0A1P8UF97_9GAMM|nr:cytochrome bc complex cytochrome b subunit [Acidihalobacter ferrooxydans]APZ42434.1 hypothetical protein BW247_04475 [Acidihalobacter ferrooxydans]
MANALEWFYRRVPMDLYREHLSEYPAPKNFNIGYYMGSLLLVMVALQFVTGLLLMMQYNPAQPVQSIQNITQHVWYGWLIWLMHTDGVSFFFALLYLHMARGLMYGSYKTPRELVWVAGWFIFLLSAGEAFIGYTLPGMATSYAASDVISQLLAGGAWYGNWAFQLVLGGRSYGAPMLMRFEAFHVVLLFTLLVVMIVVHVLLLHRVGSNNPDGVDTHSRTNAKGWPLDGIPFHPYFTVKDMVGIGVFFLIFAAVLLYNPSMNGWFISSGDVQPANPLYFGGIDIRAPWYLSPFYQLLRASPSNNQGQMIFWVGLLMPFFLPWLDRNPVRSIRYRPIYAVWLFLLFADMIGMMIVGSEPAMPYTLFPERILTVFYFAWFMLLPMVSGIEVMLMHPPHVPARVGDGLMGRIMHGGALRARGQGGSNGGES